ncbi:cardiac-enriched FHL2-interacting protein [Gastrophryne carolinensis]
MLRYKKHKRHADGVTGSSVGVMDDTDREVSSFTDRAFRSLCVAEEELFNDVPHIPSPIRGMPLSTKYHLGIFNLSVRKTQPLAQLPTVPRHRGKWAPTFQPLLNSTKDGLIIAKTNINKLCVPQPTEYKHHSKVSSLIKTFDNIENERPEQDGFFPSKGKLSIEEGNLCENVEQIDVNKEAPQSGNPDDKGSHDIRNIHRRTAREVFLESQAEIRTKLSESPCSTGSPQPDQGKRLIKQRESLRRSAFLHSENSAFKSWSDIYKRGTESDVSAPSTPPILRSPCSPLLQRTSFGTKARDAGAEVGWASPASTASSNFDTNQMLRTVPPLPNKRASKQNRDLSHRTPRFSLENKLQAEEMQVDVEYSQSPKEQIGMAKSKSPQKLLLPPYTGGEAVQKASQITQKQSEEIQEKVFKQEFKQPETTYLHEDSKISNKEMPQSGRIKTLIQKIEKEAIKDRPPSPEKKHNIKEMQDNTKETLAVAVHEKPPNPNPPVTNNVLVPPWRRTHNKTELKDRPLNKSIGTKGSAVEQLSENPTSVKEEEKSSNFSSFNITNLLTPVIRRKSVQEALEEQSMAVSPPPANTPTLKDQDQGESKYHQRNDYKARAPSLLFNLKDMRKRVKSTYNPGKVVRNSLDDNNQTADGKIPEVNGITLLDTIKQVSEEDAIDTSQLHQPNLSKEKEVYSGFHGNGFDNYLSLSSPPQVTPSKVIENGEIPIEKLHTAENIDAEQMLSPQHMLSPHLSPTDNHIKHDVAYPSLNLYHKEDTSVNAEPKQSANVEPEWSKTAKEMISQIEPNSDGNNQDELPETVATPSTFSPERDIESAQGYAEKSAASLEMERQWSIECDEDGKQGIQNGTLKDELQYYAVSNDEVKIQEQSEMLERDRKKKEDDTEELVSDKQDEEIGNVEEIKRPSSITQFKHNLFHIKDNTVKSSPVTKSVRPLLRSLSEDCLFYSKDENYSFATEKGGFRVTRPSKWKSNDSKTKLHKTASVELDEEKPWKSLSTQPPMEPLHQTPNENAENRDLWEKLCRPSHEWIKNKAEPLESVKVSNVLHNGRSSSLEGPFFHPVETCVSDVTGLSPECNTLFGHHISDSLKDLVNGDHVSSSVLANENTSYSPLENGLHFEDAVSFSEETINSPMSESVTCSMVASPMSVNTQSSGFTTALSALDDMQSPPLPCVNSRDVKSSLSVPDSVIQTPTDNIKSNMTEYIRQLPEKPLCLDSQNNAQAAKPPTVPPKTEKALRRAKRLTKKRRKTEVPQKIQDGDLKESDFVLDIPSPANINQTPITPQSHFKGGLLQPEEPISYSSSPCLPMTQRKLLQDPESGQYFMVEIPVHYRIKTFYDPETGKYLQMSLPQSERSTPTQEMSNSPFLMYQGLAPVPVASIASLKQASKMLNPSSLDMDCDSCDHSMAGTPHSMERTASSTRSPDIISIRELDDFAMEAIS